MCVGRSELYLRAAVSGGEVPGYMYTIERKRRVPSRVRRATLTVDISARGGGAGRARPTAGRRVFGSRYGFISFGGGLGGIGKLGTRTTLPACAPRAATVNQHAAVGVVPTNLLARKSRGARWRRVPRAPDKSDKKPQQVRLGEHSMLMASWDPSTPPPSTTAAGRCSHCAGRPASLSHGRRRAASPPTACIRSCTCS